MRRTDIKLFKIHPSGRIFVSAVQFCPQGKQPKHIAQGMVQMNELNSKLEGECWSNLNHSEKFRSTHNILKFYKTILALR